MQNPWLIVSNEFQYLKAKGRRVVDLVIGTFALYWQWSNDHEVFIGQKKAAVKG